MAIYANTLKGGHQKHNTLGQGQYTTGYPEGVSEDARAAMYAITPERALLYNILLCPSQYSEYISRLVPIDFTDDRVAIFQAIQTCASPDYATVETWLLHNGKAHCAAELLNIINEPASAADTPEAWIDAIKTASARRKLYHIQRQTDLLAYNGRVDPYQAIADMIPRLQAILDTQDALEEQDFQPYSLHALLERPVAPWVWRGIYRAGTRWVIYGPPYSGKSLLAGDIALSFATGTPWQEEETLQSGVVLYIAAEDAQGVARQAQVWLAAHNKELSDVEGRFYIIEDAVDLLDQADVARLIARVQGLDIHPDLVFIDTFTECFSGDVIDNRQLRLAFQGIGAIEKAFSCGSITLAHTNKAGVSWLGGQYIKATVHGMAEVTQDENGIIHLRCEKLRGARKFQERTYKLRIAEDEQGETVAVVVPAKNVPVRSGELPHFQHVALLALKDGMKATAWHKAIGEGSSGSFYEAIKELGLAGYVTKDEQKRYHPTEAGVQYIHSKRLQNNSNGANWSEDHAAAPTPIHSTHPIGCGVNGVEQQSLPEQEEELAGDDERAHPAPLPRTLPVYEPVEAAPVNQAPQSVGGAALAPEQVNRALDAILAWAKQEHYPDRLTPYGRFSGEIGPNNWFKASKLSDEQLIRLEAYLRAGRRK